MVGRGIHLGQYSEKLQAVIDTMMSLRVLQSAEVSWPAEELALVCQERLCSVELVSYNEVRHGLYLSPDVIIIIRKDDTNSVLRRMEGWKLHRKF
jgi:hypothetical protein